MPGLPATGPMALSFRPGGGVLPSEGFVVCFRPEHRAPWTGNFAAAFCALSAVYAHPDGRQALVIAGGACYVVDPDQARATSEFGGDICAAIETVEPKAVVLAGLVDVCVVTPDEVWRSPRASWDGISNLRCDAGRIFGDGWDALNDAWRPFVLDLNTKELTGGAYPKELP